MLNKRTWSFRKIKKYILKSLSDWPLINNFYILCQTIVFTKRTIFSNEFLKKRSFFYWTNYFTKRKINWNNDLTERSVLMKNCSIKNEQNRWQVNDNCKNERNHNFWNYWKKQQKMDRSRTLNEQNEKNERVNINSKLFFLCQLFSTNFSFKTHMPTKKV